MYSCLITDANCFRVGRGGEGRGGWRPMEEGIDGEKEELENILPCAFGLCLTSEHKPSPKKVNTQFNFSPRQPERTH